MVTSFKKLKTFLLENAATCLHSAEGMLKYPFVTPSFGVVAGGDDKAAISSRSTSGHYLQMYDWDSYFFSQQAKALGVSDLRKSIFLNFLSLQEDDGYVPRTVSPSRIWDNGDLFKPFLCQMLLAHVDAKPEDKSLLAENINKLDKYLSYFIKNRQHESGLFHWRNVLESGVDDNLALLAPIEAAKGENEDVAKFPDGQILAADLNAYLVAEFSAFAKLCQFVKETALAEKYRVLEDRTKTLIESKLFDQSIGMYANYDPVSNNLISLRSWTGLVPVMLGIAHNERARMVIEQNVMDSKHFLRPAGIASYAASESLYNQAPRGLYGRVKVSNWQGPMWILPNALMVRELLRSGYGQLAGEIAVRVLRTMLNDVEVNGTLHENYHAETGQPLWAPSFMSWNILALELLELVS